MNEKKQEHVLFGAVSELYEKCTLNANRQDVDATPFIKEK